MTGELFTNYAYAKKVLTRDEYAFIYLSPHLDDVAFSCSGSICAQQAQGLYALVVTLCAGNPEPPFSPLAQACHQLWQVPEGVPPYQARQREDEQAMAALGVDFAWLNWLELIYRLPTLSDFSEINASQAAFEHDPLFTPLCRWLTDLHATYPRATIVVPLGIGAHRDHCLLFQAALHALDRSTLLCFEDFPYVTYFPEETAELVKSYTLLPLEMDISDYLERRVQATSFYTSQHAMLFYPPSSFEETIRAYTSTGQHFVERYWKFA